MTEYNPEEKSHEAISPYGHEKHSEPHAGHHGTTYEGVDARAGMVIWSLVVIGGTLVFAFVMTVFIQRFLQKENPPGQMPSPLTPARIVPPAPQVQVHPWQELPEVREKEDQQLNSSGKDPDGRVHIPIDKAMDTVVSRLTIAPNALPGITTPGGEGRDFAGSVNAMPAPYRRPQIKGEIRKHAQ